MRVCVPKPLNPKVLGPGGAGRRWRLGLAVLGAAVTAAARGRRWREAGNCGASGLREMRYAIQ